MNNKNNIPKISIDKLDVSESSYDRSGTIWNATTLIDYIKKQKLSAFEVPLAAIPLWDMPFSVSCIDEFIWQANRVKNADYTKYPIILDNYGQVADGWHRIAHAILDGKKTIKAYRLSQMPKPDEIKDDDEK